MNKKEFTERLRRGLGGLQRREAEERIGFYTEIIDDRIEDGVTEEDAVNSIGDVDTIISQIRSEFNTAHGSREVIKASRMSPAMIALLILGSPIWLSLAVAVIALAISLLAVIFSLIISAWATLLAVMASSVGGVICSIIYLIYENVPAACASFGAALACAGVGGLLLRGCIYVTRGIPSAVKGSLGVIKKNIQGMGMIK